ncbi:MAG TPA: DUF642 domain-containing protein, partial [Candidatus Xenobia bacterium]|jgi:hypothetical protein
VSVAFLLLLARLGWAQVAPGPNMLVNGSFTQGPDPHQGFQHRGGGWSVAVDPGASTLPGWTVTNESVYYGNGQTINLGAKGCISQTLATRSGRHYVVTFSFVGTTDPPLLKRFTFRFGDQSWPLTFDAGAVSPQERRATVETINVVASSSSTVVAFEGTTDGVHGPFISQVSVTPSTQARDVQDYLVTLYRQASLDFNKKDFTEAFAAFLPDYTMRQLNGTSLNRNQYVSQMSGALGTTVQYTVVQTAAVGTTMAATVDVMSIARNPAGPPRVTTVRRRDLWVQTPHDYQLQSSEEQPGP